VYIFSISHVPTRTDSVRWIEKWGFLLKMESQQRCKGEEVFKVDGVMGIFSVPLLLQLQNVDRKIVYSTLLMVMMMMTILSWDWIRSVRRKMIVWRHCLNIITLNLQNDEDIGEKR